MLCIDFHTDVFFDKTISITGHHKKVSSGENMQDNRSVNNMSSYARL